MGKKILLIGGNGSGKTRLALKMAGGLSPRLYVATGTALDPEMRRKIENHKKERTGWDTLQSPTLSPDHLKTALKAKNYRCLLFDCMSFLVYNCMAEGLNPIRRMEEALTIADCERTIIVSNEIGLSPVPPSELTRRFAKLLSELNQRLVQICDESYLVVAGSLIRLRQDPE